jgi:probable HAF family extracellular repeat protein
VSINDLDQIVGDSNSSSTQHSFLYSDGTMIDLNSLFPAGTGVNLIESLGCP